MYTAIHRRQKYALSSMQKALIVRFALSYALFLTIFSFLQSQFLSRVLGYLFIGPIGFDAFPLLLPPIFITFFLFIERNKLHSSSITWPTRLGFMIRILVLLSIVALVAWITHPTLWGLSLIQTFIATYDPMAEPFVATGLYAVLFLPLVPSLALFVPKDFLRQHITTLIAGFFLLYFYIFVHPLEAFYHIATGPTLLRLVGTVLQLLPGETILSPERWEVSYRGFSIVLGPLCSGFTAIALFIAIFSVLWWLLSKRGGVYHGRAVLTLVTGITAFYFINILRIVLIMIIGSVSRTLGMTLFHGTAGSLFFFLVIVLTIRFVLPALRREERDKARQ